MSAASLSEFIDAIYPLPADSKAKFLEDWKEVSFGRNEIITAEGRTERYLYFVQEGIQRSYYLKDGKEHVIAFTYNPSFSGIPESFLTQTPSLYFLETITPTRMLRTTYDNLQNLMESDPHIERLMRVATERVLAGFIQRHHELLALNIEERFKSLLERSPHLLNMIPHKHLASYIGVDPTNFSKLLGKVKL